MGGSARLQHLPDGQYTYVFTIAQIVVVIVIIVVAAIIIYNLYQLTKKIPPPDTNNNNSLPRLLPQSCSYYVPKTIAFGVQSSTDLVNWNQEAYGTGVVNFTDTCLTMNTAVYNAAHTYLGNQNVSGVQTPTNGFTVSMDWDLYITNTTGKSFRMVSYSPSQL